jgi:dipeptide transport system permease protein
VSEIIGQALPRSLELGFCALLIAASGALIVACLLAHARSPALGASYGLLSSVIVSLPTFILAITLISAFSLAWHVLPPALWESPAHRILPVMTLAIGPFFYLSQLLVGELRKELTKAYAVTARAKGLSEMQIILKHTLRNSLNPVLGVMGTLITSLMTGSFIVESIFSIPGLGRHFVVAVIDRDYFLVTGITIVFTLFLSLFGFLSDLALWKTDPRTR